MSSLRSRLPPGFFSDPIKKTYEQTLKDRKESALPDEYPAILEKTNREFRKGDHDFDEKRDVPLTVKQIDELSKILDAAKKERVRKFGIKSKKSKKSKKRKSKRKSKKSKKSKRRKSKRSKRKSKKRMMMW
jgi:hypothetical protein